jgi:DNA polymerase-1
LGVRAVASAVVPTDARNVTTKADKRVFLLDTSSFVFRAYYALPPLSTAAGVPTHAVHGVANMFERLLRNERPTHVAACFDGPRATFRRDLYPEYKANRDEPDEDLKAQFPLVRRLVEAMDIPCVQVDGFEADDLLATLAKRFGGDGYEVVIVTGDKDLMQCVAKGVSLYDPMKNRHVNAPEVLEKFGVAPAAVADVLALMGDSSDNIPGVRGIGPKSATALIAHFGSIDEMFTRPAEIEALTLRGAKSVRKKIEEGEEQARLSLELARVREDVELDVVFDDLEIRTFVTPALQSLATELEMDRLVSRMQALGKERGLEGASQEQGPADAGPSTRRSTKVLAEASNQADVGVTDCGDAAELGNGRIAICFGVQEGNAVLLAGGAKGLVCATGERVPEALAAVVAGGASLVGYDLKAIAREYQVLAGNDGFDLGVASYLCDTSAGDHRAADLCSRFLAEELVDPTRSPEAAIQALGQVERLAAFLEPELAGRGQDKLYRELEHPLIFVLASCERAGISLDIASLGAMSVDFGARMEGLVATIYEAAGQSFNILSPVQLRQILFEKLALPSKGIKRTKTGPSTDSDSLEALADAHPLPRLVLAYRALAKLKSTYVDSLPRNVDSAGRVHTRLNQTVAATGRLSSSDPNLQNIPVRTPEGKKIRAAFIAEDGQRLVSADYNQIELRVLAHLSKDKNLCEAFQVGRDVHTATYAELFELDPSEVTPAMRREAKVVNYGIIYGMGAVRLSRELGIGRKEASEYIERYFARYPGVRGFYELMLDSARSHGWVETLFGRRRYLPDITSDHGGRRQAAERVASNTPIQGSAADIIKRAMVSLDRELHAGNLKCRLILQIHDELLLECPADEVDEASALVNRVMAGAAELAVPIVVDVGSGTNWAEAH